MATANNGSAQDKISSCAETACGQLLSLPTCSDERGNLTFSEGGEHIPFPIERVYWVYGVPGNETRGGHAHLVCEVVIVAAKGSFTVVVDNGIQQKEYLLDNPQKGLYIGKGLWRTLHTFSSDALCMVMASRKYEESDYVKDYDLFRQQRECLK